MFKAKTKKLLLFTMLCSFSICVVAAAENTKMVANAENALTANTFSAMGASIRYGTADNKQGIPAVGMRFGVSMEKTAYDAIVANQETTATFGMLYIPSELLGESALNLETYSTLTATNVITYSSVKKDGWVVSLENNTLMESYVYIYGIPAESYNRDVTAVGYATVGETTYYTAEMTRSVSEVAKFALADSEISEEHRTDLQGFLNTYTISFVDEDGTVLKTVNKLYGSTFTAAEVQELEDEAGYIKGWTKRIGQATYSQDYQTITDFTVKNNVEYKVKSTPIVQTGIQANFTATNDAITFFTDLDSLKDTLTVNAVMNNGVGAQISDYTLEGTLINDDGTYTHGNATITVKSGEFNTTFTVWTTAALKGSDSNATLSMETFDGYKTIKYTKTGDFWDSSAQLSTDSFRLSLYNGSVERNFTIMEIYVGENIKKVYPRAQWSGNQTWENSDMDIGSDCSANKYIRNIDGTPVSNFSAGKWYTLVMDTTRLNAGNWHSIYLLAALTDTAGTGSIYIKDLRYSSTNPIQVMLDREVSYNNFWMENQTTAGMVKSNEFAKIEVSDNPLYSNFAKITNFGIRYEVDGKLISGYWHAFYLANNEFAKNKSVFSATYYSFDIMITSENIERFRYSSYGTTECNNDMTFTNGTCAVGDKLIYNEDGTKATTMEVGKLYHIVGVNDTNKNNYNWYRVYLVLTSGAGKTATALVGNIRGLDSNPYAN